MPTAERLPSAGTARRWRLAASLLVRTMVLYAAFLALWPVWQEAYGRGYARAGQWLYHSFGRDGQVRFRRLETGDAFDVDATLGNRRTRQTVELQLSSRYGGYELAALESALILATPIPWRRRLRALPFALLLVHLFMALVLGLVLTSAFSNGDPVAVVQLPGPIKFLLGLATQNLAVMYTLPYVVALFVWGLTVFRRADLEALLGSSLASPTRTSYL